MRSFLVLAGLALALAASHEVHESLDLDEGTALSAADLGDNQRVLDGLVQRVGEQSADSTMLSAQLGATLQGKFGDSRRRAPYYAPVHGGWGGWGACSKTCGKGGTAFRSCNNPSPAHGGQACGVNSYYGGGGGGPGYGCMYYRRLEEGAAAEAAREACRRRLQELGAQRRLHEASTSSSTSCFVKDCCVAKNGAWGGWGAWGAWGGYGGWTACNSNGDRWRTRYRSQSRACTGASCGGTNSCPGSSSQSGSNSEHSNIKKNGSWSGYGGWGNWGGWGGWGACNSNGDRWRYRARASYRSCSGASCGGANTVGAAYCLGSTSLTDNTSESDKSNFKVHCAQSSWSSWSTCTKSCGSGSQQRTRSTTTATSCGGNACAHAAETQACNAQACPVDCVVVPFGGVYKPGVGLGLGANWNKCSVACGGGYQFRTRDLTAPKHGGKACPPSIEYQGCNSQACCVKVTCYQGGWGGWTAAYGNNGLTNGSKYRTRTTYREGSSCSGDGCGAVKQWGTYGGSCTNGALRAQKLRNRENHCGSCNDGYYRTGIFIVTCAPLTNCGTNQYQSTAPTATSNRKCSACKTACTGSTYQTSSCANGNGSNRACAPLTNCGTGEYQSKAPTATSDRDCSACGPACTGSFFESTACANGNTNQNRGCTGWNTCDTTTEYETKTPSNAYGADRECGTHTTCTDDQFESKAPTTSSARECLGRGSCTNGSLISAASATKVNHCGSGNNNYYVVWQTT